MEVFADAMERLGQVQYQIDPSSTDSHLTGTVTTTVDNQLMFTSIPYDEGWNIYVDGEKVELYEANNSLVSFYVEGVGEHSVEMKYMPATVALGITISIVCLVIFIALLILYPFIKKVPYLRKLIMIEGEELPALASEEYMADIEPGDIGSVSDKEPPSLDDELRRIRERDQAAKEAAKESKARENEERTKHNIPPKKDQDK